MSTISIRVDTPYLVGNGLLPLNPNPLQLNSTLGFEFSSSGFAIDDPLLTAEPAPWSLSTLPRCFQAQRRTLIVMHDQFWRLTLRRLAEPSWKWPKETTWRRRGRCLDRWSWASWRRSACWSWYDSTRRYFATTRPRTDGCAVASLKHHQQQTASASAHRYHCHTTYSININQSSRLIALSQKTQRTHHTRNLTN